MAVQVQETAGGKVLEVHASEKLTKEDYETFAPRVEELIKRAGKLHVLFVMQNFHGWEVGTLWEDLKFDMNHFRDIAKLAVVGENKWEAGMSAFCQPFTSASIRYFDQNELDAARKWVAE